MHIEELIKQKSYERIVYVLRRHPITFIPILVVFIILLLVPVALGFLATTLFPEIVASPTYGTLLILLASAYTIAIFVFFFAQFIDFYLDIWIVTNDRIIDVEQFGLFARTISELDLFRIQDVTTDVHGFFATIFKFGVVTIKTASSNKNIVFKNIPDPNTIRENLIRLSHEDRKYHYNQPASPSEDE